MFDKLIKKLREQKPERAVYDPTVKKSLDKEAESYDIESPEELSQNELAREMAKKKKKEE